MGVTCKIITSNPSYEVFYPGQSISGVIKLFIDKPMKINELKISLTGKGECSWTEMDYIWLLVGRIRIVRCVGKEEHVTQQIKITSNTPDNTMTVLNTGEHEFPFNFVLPNDIPSSFTSGTGTITYEIDIKMVKPALFSFDKTFNCELLVHEYVPISMTNNEGPLSFELEKKLYKPFSSISNIIKLMAVVDKTIYAPGETARVTYRITNNCNARIKAIITRLICKTTYTVKDRSKSSTQTINKSVIESSSELDFTHLTTEIPIPTNVCSIYHSHIIHRAYKVMVTVRLPLPHFNFKAQAPIVIGLMSPGEQISLRDNEDQPPTYTEAVQS